MATKTDWQKSLPKSDWAHFLDTNPLPLSFKSRKEEENFIKELLNDIDSFLLAGKLNRAIDFISLVLCINKAYSLERIKKNGFLRHSRYLNVKNPVPSISTHLIRYKNLFRLSPKEQIYLESLNNFTELYSEIKILHNDILKKIKTCRGFNTPKVPGRLGKLSIIKSLLAINEYNFLTEREAERELYSYQRMNFYTKEEISEGISLLLLMLNERLPINKEDLIFIDYNFINSKIASQLILAACKLRVIKELEISIESFGYVCYHTGEKTIVRQADIDLAKSIELSHIIYKTQTDTDKFYVQQFTKEFPSLKALATEINDKYPNTIELKTIPYKRFRLNIALPIIEFLCKKQIDSFAEEMQMLSHVEKELLIPQENLIKYELSNGFTLYDFILFNRVFVLLYFLFSNKFLEYLNSDNRDITFDAILILFKKNEIVELLEKAGEPSKVEKYLKMICWETGSNEPLDLQYTPIIQKDDYFLVQPSVLANSNTVRNIFPLEAKRRNNFKAGQMPYHEQIPHTLVKSFKEKGFLTGAEFKVTYDSSSQTESDIDFYAFKDGYLFIAECKDTIHSTDAFEYRTTVNVFEKAVSQLDYLNSALSDPSFLKEFCSRTGIEMSEIKQMQFIIVPSVRKLYGYHINGYPVRNVHELTAFVNKGVWNYQIPGEDLLSFRLWAKQDFQVSDLINFCQNNGPHQAFLSSMEEYSVEINKTTEITSYFLNLSAAINNLKQRYKYSIHKSEELMDQN
ncbi:hypothetical protein [Chitinophaga sp. sic0106]|uniref:hypothetical protein n=1 Tax=Chitinophaga sp. sic0106 TaxID=2854785 RepID=UPI001C462359|nr:hypothetical protein [Chitinophaga sp. sic0106]MBV7533823.1 hypothetical protein [Chitinophaga sp. sic0106]